MNRILFKKCNGSGLNKLFVFLLAILIFPECYGQTEAVTKRLTIIAGPSLLTVPNTNLGLQTGLQYNFARWSVLSEIAFPLYIKDKEMHSRFIRFRDFIFRCKHTSQKVNIIVSTVIFSLTKMRLPPYITMTKLIVTHI